MYDDEMIIGLFNNFLEVGGSPKVTEFKKHLDMLIKAKIKPLCSGRGKAAGQGSNMETSWRNEQKENFAGRGAKWIKRSLEEIESTLQRFEKDDIDCSDYRAWTKQAGYAWVRYAGPRVENGVAMAAFEVRTEGSKKDQPKQTYRMYNLNMMEHIELLGGTPHAMNLEVIATPDVATEASSDEPVSDETVTGAHEAERDEELEAFVEAEASNEVPTSDDPAEWEEFLTAEGLGMDQLEDEDEDNIYGEF